MVSKSSQAALDETLSSNENFATVQNDISLAPPLAANDSELQNLDTINQSPKEEKIFSEEKLDFNPANVANVASLDFDETIEPLEQAMQILDDIFLRCKDNPSLLSGQEFKDAYALVCEDEALKFEYRTKLKKAKPSGVLMSSFKELESESASGSNAGNESIAGELISLVMSRGELFFDDYTDKTFVSVLINDIEHTMAIGSKNFIDWLSYSYYQSIKGESEFGSSASDMAIKQACSALNGIAKYDGKKQRAYLRTAQHGDGYCIFLANEKMQVVEVLPTGWRVFDKPPVKFWKSASMQALPVPIKGGNVSELWQFINVPVEDRPLVLAWMLETFRSEFKKPVFAITGMQGTAKSSTHDKIRQLTDPNTVNLRAAPKNREDIFVSAGCNWMVSFENISHLKSDMQDALCTLSTGGGFASRTLYTNTEETIITVLRPVIINSIPTVITAQDLTDRVIAIELSPIPYKEDSELNAAWEEAKPRIFGALLDLFVEALVKLPEVTLKKPPRMADFTKLGEAMMQSYGEDAGFFTDLYANNRAKSIAKAMESSPIAIAICALVEKTMSTLVYRGTIQDLLSKLSSEKSQDESFPRSPRGLSDALKRQAPALLTCGIEITIGNSPERINGSRGTVVEIRKVIQPTKNNVTVQSVDVYDDEERF